MGKVWEELQKAARQTPQDLCGKNACLTVFQYSNSGHVLMIYWIRTFYAVVWENRTSYS
jgi:hypothetical protein